MQTGDIVIVAFPFTDLIGDKARPALVVAVTDDVYKDVIVCMISSVLPQQITSYQLLLQPTITNKLRAVSILKINRIVTVENNKVIARIGMLDSEDLIKFKLTFKSLVD